MFIYRLTGFMLVFTICLNLMGQNPSFKMPQGIPPDLALGMPLSGFKKAVDMNAMRVDDTRSWRRVYFQPSPDPNIRSLIYYVAKELEDQPLYEVIISYTSHDLARENARNFFGAPNHISEDSEVPDEWRFKATPDDIDKWAWIYKDQIVIVAKVPGCEWDEEWGDN